MASLSEFSYMESNEETQQPYWRSLPPGYRFCPTDKELVHFYLRKKVNKEMLPPHQIVEVNLYHHSPDYLAATYKDFGGDNGLYFFTPRDRRYQNGTRPKRSTSDGYWKATGADKPVRHDGHVIGYKKVLVFYQGNHARGTKTNWIMHEYTLKNPPRTRSNPDDMKLDEWVLCKIYERKKRQRDIEREDQNNLPPEREHYFAEDEDQNNLPQLTTLPSYSHQPLCSVHQPPLIPHPMDPHKGSTYPGQLKDVEDEHQNNLPQLATLPSYSLLHQPLQSVHQPPQPPYPMDPHKGSTYLGQLRDVQDEHQNNLPQLDALLPYSLLHQPLQSVHQPPQPPYPMDPHNGSRYLGQLKDVQDEYQNSFAQSATLAPYRPVPPQPTPPPCLMDGDEGSTSSGQLSSLDNTLLLIADMFKDYDSFGTIFS